MARWRTDNRELYPCWDGKRTDFYRKRNQRRAAIYSLLFLEEDGMTWSFQNSQGHEARKIVWEIVPYMHGRALDLGAGPYKVLPHFIGVDDCRDTKKFGIQMKPDIRTDATDLSMFASQSCDCIFSSHLLEHIAYERVPDTLQEWMRVLRQGGHLILYLPADDAYPHIGASGANPDHRWEPNYDKVVSAMEQIEVSWDLVDYQHRTQDDEYSVFFVFKKL